MNKLLPVRRRAGQPVVHDAARRRSVIAAAAAALGWAAAAAGSAPPAGAAPAASVLANACFAVASLENGKFVALDGLSAYRAAADAQAGAAAFYFKPSGLGTYLLADPDGKLLGVDDRVANAGETAGGAVSDAGGQVSGTGSAVAVVPALGPAGDAAAGAGGTIASAGQTLADVHAGGNVTRADQPGKLAEWAVKEASRGVFTIASTAEDQQLAVAPDGTLTLTAQPTGSSGLFAFVPDTGCRSFPEAEVGAIGEPFEGTNPDGTVSGFADLHLHVTTDLRAGGRVIFGRSFDPFGITQALGADGDEQEHGPDGTLDVTGNLLRSGVPAGIHDNHGWPTFAGWPVHDTITHQQVYWVWLERAWMAGLRLIVAQTVEDESLCWIEPQKAHSCDETASIELQVARLRALQDYIDAQDGGPGRGWFRIVESPQEARRAIERGQLAVVIGVESSNPFGCREFQDQPQCSRADVDRGLDRYRKLGIRSFFVAHWVDNAFAGAAFEGGATGTFLNLFNKLETGHYFRAEQCPEPGEGEALISVGHFFPGNDPISTTLNQVQSEGVPTYPSGRLCNAKGLTDLGRYLIQQMIARHMLIDMDHMSEKARESVLAIAAANRYPLVSSHTGTGGEWTPSQLQRLYVLGGLATARLDTAPQLVETILALRPFSSNRFFFGVGLGSDTGGFSALPGPRKDAAQHPLSYPFTSHDGSVTFTQQQTGERLFDLNTDGVAHYGLIPDLVADMQQQPGGSDALTLFFRSAEAYLEMWERAAHHRD